MRALISILMLNGFCISALACFTSVLSRSVDNKHLNKPNLNICMTVLYERISMLWRRIGDKYRLRSNKRSQLFEIVGPNVSHSYAAKRWIARLLVYVYMF